MLAPAKKTVKRNWSREVAGVLGQVFADHPDAELTLDDIYHHAMDSGRIPQEYIEGVHETALKKAFGRILRMAKIASGDGRDVRQFQSYTEFVQGENGEELQLHFWRDIRHMSRGQMMVAVNERMVHIEGAKTMLVTDVEFWNENVRRPRERRIQLDFAFAEG